MAIGLHTEDSWVAANATTQTVTLPTHSTGDMLIVRCGMKHATLPGDITCATAGWARIDQHNNGTTGSGNGSGDVQIAAFWKVAASGAETNPVITYHASVAATPSAAVATSFSKAGGEVWDTPLADAGSIAAATSYSATMGSHIAVAANDWCVGFSVTNDNTTLTSPTFTQTGITFAAVVESPAAALSSATSNDIAADGCYRVANSGTSSAAAVFTGTNSVADVGAAMVIQLRVTTAAPQLVTPTTLAVVTTGFEPTVTTTNNQLVTPDVTAVVTASFAPTATTTDNQTVTPDVTSLVLSQFAPDLTITDHQTVTPDVAALTTASFAPTVTASDHQSVVPTTASLTTASFAPTVTATASDVYRDGMLATSPQSYWRHGESSGTLATDEMGNHDGTYRNAPTFSAAGALVAISDTAVTFNGTNEGNDIGDITEFDGTASWTLAAWVKHTADGTYRRIFSKEHIPGARWGVLLWSQNTAVGVERYNGGASLAATSSAINTSYHFLVGTYDGSRTRLYVDGALAATSSGTDSSSETDQASTFTIGGYSAGAGADHFNGTIDEPALWTRALTLAEINRLYLLGTTILAEPTNASLTLATFVPTVTASDHQSVTPTTAALVTATFAPTASVTNHVTVTPDLASLTLTALAPVVTATDPQLVTVDLAVLTLTSFAPNVGAPVEVVPTTASLALSLFAPVISTPVTATPDAAALTLATFVASVLATNHQSVSPETAALVTELFAPSVEAPQNWLITPGTRSLVTTSYAPTAGVPVLTIEEAPFWLVKFGRRG